MKRVRHHPLRIAILMLLGGCAGDALFVPTKLQERATYRAIYIGVGVLLGLGCEAAARHLKIGD